MTTDPSTTEGEPTLRDLFAVAASATADGEYGDLPAKVLSYTPATQLANVQPVVLVPRRGALQLVAPVHDVQVRWPAGSTWALTGPLTPGVFGWLRPAGADISAWKMRGLENNPLAKVRRGALADAVFEPGGQPATAPLPAAAYHATAAVLYAATELLLGDSAAVDFVALTTKVVAELQNIRTFFDAHTHPTAPSGPVSPPTLLFSTAPVPGPIGNVGATKVKAI